MYRSILKIMAGSGALLACCAATVQAAVVDVTSSSDPIVALVNTSPTGGNQITTTNYSASETPPNLIDNSLSSKHYNNFTPITATSASGFVVTPAAPSTVTSISFATANDSKGRDPLTFILQGSNDPNALASGNSSFTTIFTGDTGLEPITARNTQGPDVNFPNTTPYSSYRVLFTVTRPDESQRHR